MCLTLSYVKVTGTRYQCCPFYCVRIGRSILPHPPTENKGDDKSPGVRGASKTSLRINNLYKLSFNSQLISRGSGQAVVDLC